MPTWSWDQQALLGGGPPIDLGACRTRIAAAVAGLFVLSLRDIAARNQTER
jgi:hypothetical protein